MTHNYVWQPWQYTIHSSTDSPSENLVKTNRRTERSLLTVMEYAANLERSPEEQFADTIFYTSIMAIGLILTHLGVIKLIRKYTGTSLCSHSYSQSVYSYQYHAAHTTCPLSLVSCCSICHSGLTHCGFHSFCHPTFIPTHSLTLLRYMPK